MSEKFEISRRATPVDPLANCPPGLIQAMAATAVDTGCRLHLVGGALRDWLRGEVPNDLDFTIEVGAAAFLRTVRNRLGRGTVVVLGEPDDDTCRLVVDGIGIDVSGYRDGTTSIEADLARRDFTINALAIELDTLLDGRPAAPVDPLGGLADLQQGIVRACPGAFVDDPLRMLRAFRFAAQYGFVIEAETQAEIVRRAGLIERTAAERIAYELEQIMASTAAGRALNAMHDSGLLFLIAPELAAGDGVDQPPFHHLDVLRHNLETLVCLERVVDGPARYFPGCPGTIEDYLADLGRRVPLKWAALFHDVGKPSVRRIAEESDGRITFHRHDEVGAMIFQAFAERLRWSRRASRQVAGLIAMHMHPFHLCNVMREAGGISRRAGLKICRKALDDLPAVFLIAMADCLAGQGPDKPERMERELAELYCWLEELAEQALRPVLAAPKLLTGNDLIDTFGLVPGPLFRELLEGLEMAAIEGDIATREQALAWVRDYLERQ